MKLYRPRFNQPPGTPDSELKPNPVRRYASCDCLTRQYKNDSFDEQGGDRESVVVWRELSLHSEIQDTSSEAWKSLEAYIGEVRAQGGERLNPMDGIGREKWEQITTLPASIGTLQSVKFMSLYGSHLVRIPPEIGGMTNLEVFDPYTSYCLHWFPFEITRCKKLKMSRISTRALYGNYKYRPPFPRLPQLSSALMPSTCSVCDKPFSQREPTQVWISVKVGTDVVPLLAHACSDTCIKNLPKPAAGYVQRSHQGGLDLEQPASF